ncbi:hypothetical protein [Paraburkholderia sp. JHI869]|uniref:hypothetical protein n=1 Tax=Paraburkholderia sp. JHI869 TaxID=3112959 RepID=UPI003177117A
MSTQLREEFLQQLDRTITDAHKKATRNYAITYAIYIGAFIGSLAGTLVPLLAAGDIARKVGAVAALLPAIALTAFSAFRFNVKAAWHNERMKKLREIERSLKIVPEEKLPGVIDRWNRIESGLLDRWKGFGELPGAFTPGEPPSGGRQ